MNCKKCKSGLKYKIFHGTSWLSTLFIALVPKCSLCIVAYSSAITVCGGKELYLTHGNWLSYLPLVFSALVVGLILYNFRDQRSWAALFFALLGAFILVSVRQFWLPETYYYFGSGLLFLGVWVNGSLLSIIKTFKKKLSLSGIWLK